MGNVIFDGIGAQGVYRALVADYVARWPHMPPRDTGAWQRQLGQQDMIVHAAMVTFGEEEPAATMRVGEDLADVFAAVHSVA